MPFEFDYDRKVGPLRKGHRVTLELQPVVPIHLNDDWIVLSRTIVPVVWQNNIAPGLGSQSGLGDTFLSFFLSPAKPGQFIWGVGPALGLPTRSPAIATGRT